MMSMPTTGAPSLFGDMFQLAYVTSDIDRATALFRDRYGTGDFHVMRDIPGDRGTVSIALAFADRLNIELIEPGAGAPLLYTKWISGIAGFALRHHHIGLLVDTTTAWDAMRARFVEHGTAIAMEGYMPGALDYLYADTVRELGHYLEYVRPYEGGMAMFRAVPGNPWPSA